MKIFYRATLIGLVTLMSASLFAQAGTPAAPAPAPTGGVKVGVIDIQTAILATNEGQRDFNALSTKFEPKRTEVQNMSKQVDALQKQLDAPTGTDEAKAGVAKQLDVAKKNLQRTYEDAQAEFDGQKNEILKRLGDKVYATLDKYAKEHGYSVILDVSGQQTPVLWAAESTNITKAVVDAYNAVSGVPAPATPAAKPASTTPSTTRPPATSH
jgi:outer membrane protein